ncbi:MAG: glutamyl-tRNA reductase [Ignavibacteriaceae bacterium]|nr:glutamyl-tRNA reductase [Ignavibacteriaceae bacterium]
MMNILAVSINHHTAPVELREAFHLNSDEIKNLIHRVKEELFSEGLIISTCNRTELYGIPKDQKLDVLDIQNFIFKYKNNKEVKPENFQTFASSEAIKHLFKVISGIDSLLIGDNQIYHQVKEAFQTSEEMQFAGVLMKRIFDAATKTGKRAISETEISEGAVTVSYAAVQLIEKIFSSISKKSALIIGAGESGELAAKHLKDRGIGRLVITNRTLERAEKIARELDFETLPFNTFKEKMHEFDIILSATSADELIITKEDIRNTMKERNHTSLVLMDIAIPRDIDPSVKEIDYVFYHDIDSLNIIVEQNLSKRKFEIPRIEKIIDEEIDTFIGWYNSLEVAPTIKDLRDYFENIRAEEVGKNKNRFSTEDQEKVEIITKRIINKILHQPTVGLKKINDFGTTPEETAVKVNVLRDIFGINHNNKEEKE